MARNSDELTAIVRAQFPLIFSLQDPIETEAYRARRNALIDYATAVSAPPLSAETTRYQTILLASALVFLSFGLLDVSSFKIADATIALDWKAFAFYAVFLAGVGTVFCFRAWVDYDRAGFSRAKNAEAIGEVRHLIAVGQLSERVEQYYREQLDREIIAAYRVYDAKVMASVDATPTATPDIRLADLDVAAVRASPELAGAIERHETWLAEMRALIAEDLQRLVGKADEALLVDRLAVEQAGAPYLAPRHATQAIRDAYDETLAPWLDMRNELASNGLKSVFERVEHNFVYGKLSELSDVLQKVLRIRRWSFRLEVLLPLALAAGAAALVSWHVLNHGLPQHAPSLAASPQR
jgi:hypothetical protein